MYKDIDSIYPYELQEKYNYLEIGNKYISTMLVLGYPSIIQLFSFTNVFYDIGESNISIFIDKEEKSKILKKITNIIATSKEELISTHENRIDTDKLNNNINMAKMMRNAIQVENEDVYQIKIYISINADDVETLKERQKKIINYFYSRQFVLKPANFRQKESYLATLPIMYKNKKDNEMMMKYLTSTSLAKLFPFYTTNIIEKTGIIIGSVNGKVCMFDIFSNSHSNYNMSVLGSSGSGKSYILKLMILRNAYLGRKQIIFDPEGEYSKIVLSLGGKVIYPKQYNLLYISESWVNLYPNDFLDKKINMLLQQLEEIFQMDESDKEILKAILEEVYKDKNINNKLDSMYTDYDENKLYIKRKYIEYIKFPTMLDFINKVKISKKINKVKKQYILDSLKKIQQVKKEQNEIGLNNIISFNMKDLTNSEFKLYMNIFFYLIEEMKEDKTLIYIDEIWKCISFGSDERLTTKIFNMFKTLRKEKMGIITSTQDISDFFTYQNGLFGKSILNNSYNKMIFNLQYIDSFELAKAINKNKEDIEKIKLFERGKAFMQIGNSNFEINVKASEWEHNLIEGRALYEDNVDSDGKSNVIGTDEKNGQIYDI